TSAQFERPTRRRFFCASRKRAERLAAHRRDLPARARRVSKSRRDARLARAERRSLPPLSFRSQQARHCEADTTIALRGAAHVLQISRRAPRPRVESAQARATAEARSQTPARAHREASRRVARRAAANRKT